MKAEQSATRGLEWRPHPIARVRTAVSSFRKEVMGMAKTLYKPGMDNKPAGRYREVGPRGGAVSNPRTVTIGQGDRLPPTQEPNRRWARG